MQSNILPWLDCNNWDSWQLGVLARLEVVGTAGITETGKPSEHDFSIRLCDVAEYAVDACQSLDTFNLHKYLKNVCILVVNTSSDLSLIGGSSSTRKSLFSIPALGPGFDIVSLPYWENVWLSLIQVGIILKMMVQVSGVFISNP